MIRVERLHQIVTDRCRADQFSGVVRIQRGEEILFDTACGLASRRWAVPNRANTRFRIASISKMFTAVAVLQLIDAGQITLETRVVECLDLADTTIPDEVTLFHLLTMTAGIADWFEESGDWAANWEALRRVHPLYLLRRNADYLLLFINKSPLRPTGEMHQYSNASYILLGLVIEQVAGIDYFDYVRQNIFSAADMDESDFLALDDVHENVAEGYIPVKSGAGAATKWQRNIYMATAAGAADGGATSTAADLVRFSQALRKGELLSMELTQSMLTPKVLESEERDRDYTWMYGFGNFFLLDDENEIVRWGHTGEEDGVSCRLYHYPQRGLDVVIVGNQSGCAGVLGWEVHDLIVNDEL